MRSLRSLRGGIFICEIAFRAKAFSVRWLCMKFRKNWHKGKCEICIQWRHARSWRFNWRDPWPEKKLKILKETKRQKLVAKVWLESQPTWCRVTVPSKLRIDKSWTSWLRKRHNANRFMILGDSSCRTGCWTATKMYKDVQCTKYKALTWSINFSRLLEHNAKENADSLLLSSVMWFGTSVFCLAFHSNRGWHRSGERVWDVPACSRDLMSGIPTGHVQPQCFSLRRAESSSSLGSLWISSKNRRIGWQAK